MVFHWSLGNSKSPQVFRTLLSTLANLNSAVWSLLLLLFPIPPNLLPILWWLYRAYQLQLVLPSLSCSVFFSIPYQGPGTYLSLCFLYYYYYYENFSLEFEWQQVSSGFQANLNSAVVWMVSMCPLISKSLSLFTKPLGIVPRILITFIITIIVCMFSRI